MGKTLGWEHRCPWFDPRYSRYIAAGMTTYNVGPLLLRPVPSGRLKNLGVTDKGSSLRVCLSLRGMSVTRG